jgi:hypothetical protein
MSSDFGGELFDLIHAASEFIAGGPEGGVEVGFLDGHEESGICGV